jgi:hypothetical protein
LYRSRRPALVDDYFRNKGAFQEAAAEKRLHIIKTKEGLTEMRKVVCHASRMVLKKFCDDARALHLERKWNDSPEWHTDEELKIRDDLRLQRERQQQLELEEEVLMKRKKRSVRMLLPFEIEEIEGRERDSVGRNLTPEASGEVMVLTDSARVLTPKSADRISLLTDEGSVSTLIETAKSG